MNEDWDGLRKEFDAWKKRDGQLGRGSCMADAFDYLKATRAPPEPLPREQSVTEAAEALDKYFSYPAPDGETKDYLRGRVRLERIRSNLRAALDREARAKFMVNAISDLAEEEKGESKLRELALAVKIESDMLSRSGVAIHQYGETVLREKIGALAEEAKRDS